jgi:hypothetical protein
VTDFDFIIDVPARGEWKNIDFLRESVESCAQAVLSNVACGQALSIAAGELLENAVKYGDWSTPERKFRLRVWGAGGRAYVQVENPIARDDEGPREVERMLQWIKSFSSPREAYRARLREVAAADHEGGSRLGLVRIACEARCEVSAELRGDALRVTAVRTLMSQDGHR